MALTIEPMRIDNDHLNAGLRTVECRRHWKSDSSGFVIVDGSVIWKVLEG
jgi:hypothetical protein